MSDPCETLSPTFHLISFTTPSSGDGTSIDALSDSSVINGCSVVTGSPGFTSTSITGTSFEVANIGYFDFNDVGHR